MIISFNGHNFTRAHVLNPINSPFNAGGIVVPFMLSETVQATSSKAALVLFPIIGVIGFMLALSSRKQLTIVSQSDGSMNTSFRSPSLAKS